MNVYSTYLSDLTFQLVCFWASHWIFETAQSDSGTNKTKMLWKCYLWNTYCVECGCWRQKLNTEQKEGKKPNLHKNGKNWLCLCSIVGSIIWALSSYWLGWYRFVGLLDWVGFVSRFRGGHRLHADIDTHSRWDKPPYAIAVARFRHRIKTIRFCMDCHIQAAQWFPSAIRRIITYKWAISGFLLNHHHMHTFLLN